MTIYVNRVDAEPFDGTPASVQRIVDMLKALGFTVTEYAVKPDQSTANDPCLHLAFDPDGGDVVGRRVVRLGYLLTVDHGDVRTMSRSAFAAEGYEPEAKPGLAGVADALFGPRYSTEPRS